MRHGLGWHIPLLFLGFCADEHYSQITQPFELYITLPPSLPKTAAINAANSVARWVKKEEHRLFLKDAPVL